MILDIDIINNKSLIIGKNFYPITFGQMDFYCKNSISILN